MALLKILLCWQTTSRQKIIRAFYFPMTYCISGRWMIMGHYGYQKKGLSLKLTAENYSVYERAIRVYEGNEFEMKGGRFFLNGKEATSYTFKMDYYWMMGDNRHYSQDSRFWGFVPEDRIVGKPTFIFFSWQKGPRWKRFFKAVK